MKQTPRAPHVADALADLAAHTGADPGDALASRLDALAALGDRPAPVPTGDLAALLAGATPLAPRRARRHRGALTAGAVVLALAAGTGAAAADVLPDRVQRAVAVFSEHFLPFNLPRPHPAQPAEAPGTPARPATTPAPAGRPTALPGVRPTTAAPSPLPGHRATSAPTTVPTPGQHGRSRAHRTRPPVPVRPTHPVTPVHPTVPLPTRQVHPSHPLAPTTATAESGSAGSHRGGVEAPRSSRAAEGSTAGEETRP